MKSFWVFLLLTVSWAPASAYELGLGLSSQYSGRYVPAITAGMEVGSLVLAGSAAGVQTPIYYHSSYTLGAYVFYPAGEVLANPLTGGVGLAGSHSERGYRDSTSSSVEKKIDTVAGPAFRLRWYLMGSGYFGLDWIFGIRSLGYLLALSGQDVVVVSVGVSL